MAVSRAWEDYLWDGSGAADPEVQALEELLRPLGHDGRPLGMLEVGRHRPVRWRLLLLAAALVLALTGTWWVVLGGGGSVPREKLSLRVVRSGSELTNQEWFTAADDNHELELLRDGQLLGTMRLDAGSRMQVRVVSPEETRLYLAERGRMEAFVAADVPARFFQVDTPAARCIDLGCEYTLTVDDDGNAHVRVTSGWVSFLFEDRERTREVFVPRGAECLAERVKGPGTPRFTDMDSEAVVMLDMLDAADPELERQLRRDLAEKLGSRLVEERDSLVLYHLSLDADPVVSGLSEKRLVDLMGFPPEAEAQKLVLPLDRGLWLNYLRPFWW